MTEKTVSKYLLNLEKHFTNDNPVLLKAAKIFHDLDQFEFDLGLLDTEETTASRSSWWPIVSLIGGNSTAKSKFINNYLGTDQLASGIQTAGHKFTVLLHNNQPNTVTLPGTALDVDHRYPFYQISQKIEQRQRGEGSRINAYLELKTIHSERLKGKLFVDAPNMGASQLNPIDSLLTTHIIEHSDLVLVFTDVFETITPLVNELIQQIIAHQDSNRFVFIVEQTAGFMTPANSHDLIAAAQRKLFDLGINVGQFIALAGQQNLVDFSEIDQRMANVAHDRSYRVLDCLERSIHDLEDIAIVEVRKGIEVWKERSNVSSLIILCFIIFLGLLIEMNTGLLLDSLFDPILGPIMVLILTAIMVPLHLVISKLQAKLIINRLNARQKQLLLTENLANLFEKSLTVGRILLPVGEPVGWNKKAKARLSQLLDRTKQLVQSLNDDFGSYDEQSLKDYLDSIK